jgi:diguanylate cyclase (GGDEF)-like protein
MFHVSIAGGPALSLALVEDPGSRDGTLVIWRPGKAKDLDQATAAALCDHAVRYVQNESRWHRKLDKTQALIYRDDLTGLYNMRYLEVVLESELRRAQRFPAQFCLLFIDLDGFKAVNDDHGHLSGSSVLKQVADVLRDAVREVDVPIRYGGDEFVVVLLGASPAKGYLAAERVRRRIEQKEFQVEDGGTARLTCSIGVAAYPEHGKDRETLLKVADETMYNSKRTGKNRVTIVSDLERS